MNADQGAGTGKVSLAEVFKSFDERPEGPTFAMTPRQLYGPNIFTPEGRALYEETQKTKARLGFPVGPPLPEKL